MKAKIRIGCILLTLLIATGCGYRLSGTGSNVPEHIKTLAIPVFKNTSSEPTIQRQLTDTIRRAFLTDGRLKLVDKKSDADLLMNGTLNFYDIRAVAFDVNDVATEYWVYLGIQLDAVDQVKETIYLKENFRTRWNYQPTTSVVDAEAQRQEALREAYRDVAIRLVSLVIDRF